VSSYTVDEKASPRHWAYWLKLLLRNKTVQNISNVFQIKFRLMDNLFLKSVNKYFKVLFQKHIIFPFYIVDTSGVHNNTDEI
jgi:hypothetical protein